VPDGPWIVIKNWDKYGPKPRNKHAAMPWIKVYRKLLEDRDYRRIAPEYRSLLVDLWLLAVENDGKVTAILPDLAFRLRAPEDWLTLGIEAIAAIGFIDVPLLSVDKSSTSRSQVVNDTSTERRGEERRGEEKGEFKPSPKATGFDLAPFLDAWKEKMGAYPTNPGLLGRLLKPLAGNGNTAPTLARWKNFVVGVAKTPQYFGTEAKQFHKFAATPSMYDEADWWMSPQDRREVDRLTEGLGLG
jgi:hypothetical protein